MTLIDTIADKYYCDRVKMAFAFTELLNEEAKALKADGVDVRSGTGASRRWNAPPRG